MKTTLLSHIFLILCLTIMPPFVGAQTIPEEARRHMARGEAAVEMARSPQDYEAAIKEFQKGAELAPMWPAPYYNLGLAQERAGKLKEAITSLNRYLQLAPDVPDAAKVKEHVYKLEYKAEQVLTVPEIIDVLVSLSDEQRWQVVGDCSQDQIKFRRNEFASDKYVSAMTAYTLPSGQPWYGAERVNGQVLKYLFNTQPYERGECAVNPVCCDDECIWWEEREVEVVSKTLVRVKQKHMKNVPRGKPEAGVVASIKACTFQKK
jgi:hypothetical protein